MSNNLPEGVLPASLPAGLPKGMLVIDFGPEPGSYDWYCRERSRLEKELVEEEAIGVMDDYAGATALSIFITGFEKKHPEHAAQFDSELAEVAEKLGSSAMEALREISQHEAVTSGTSPRVYWQSFANPSEQITV